MVDGPGEATGTAQAFIVLVSNGQGKGRGHLSLLPNQADAESFIEGLLNDGVPPANIRAFRVRPLDIAAVAAPAVAPRQDVASVGTI